MEKIIYIIFCFTLFYGCKVSEKKQKPLSVCNPLLPGYFADPSIKKFGDKYYIYSTTDGVKLASGEPTVWVSDDLVNWYNYELDIDLPQGLTNCWAPDVVKGKLGLYYYYMGNCQFGCNIYGYVADNPIGPWNAINGGKPVIPVGSGKEGLPALDAQFLFNDKGELYTYFGTWCSHFGGLGWAKMNTDDMCSMEKSGFIPKNQLPNVFEAAYPIQRNGKYILMYSSGDCRLSTYSVHYAYANHPEGPYTYGQNNPILETNEDLTIDSPGHHSIIEIDNHTYIVYHRHNNPHSTGGEFRQVCMDELVFLNDSTIQRIEPTHKGITTFKSKHSNIKNLAFGVPAEASSVYHLKSRATVYTKKPVDYVYDAKNITDENNGTLWKASSSELPQSVILDLGVVQPVKRILTQFEYSTYYYQYKLEVSTNKKDWVLFADKTANKIAGCPMIDDENGKGRYVRLTITGTEKTGMLAGVWNMKVYNKRFKTPGYHNSPKMNEGGKPASGKLEVSFNVSDLPIGDITSSITNEGNLSGEFIPVGNCTVKTVDNKKGLFLDGNSYLELSVPAPKRMDWNAPFSTSAWIYVTSQTDGKCIVSWNSRDNMLQASYAAMMYGFGNFGAMAHGDGSVDMPFTKVPSVELWHHIAITFDGMKESVYVDGRLDNQMPINLFVKADKIRIGASGFPSENYIGYLSDIRLYNKCLNSDEIKDIVTQ